MRRGGARKLVAAMLAAVAAVWPCAGYGAAPGPTLPRLVSRESQAAIDKALGYLSRTQRADGSWLSGGTGGSYVCSMTSLAGLALMAGGSTPEHGPYARQVKKAMLFILSQQDRQDGLIGGGDDGRSMYGHGFAMLFLAQCYGMEGSGELGEQLRDALERAVSLTVKSQSRRGGWIYTPTGQGDEGSVTVTQLQALRACRNVGIHVPRETVDRAVRYLQDCQNPDGGISYSYQSRGGSRPPISAAAIACFYAAGVHEQKAGGAAGEADFVGRLIEYCLKTVRPTDGDGFYFYMHYYMAQAMYMHGGPDYERYYPQIRNRLVEMQSAEGSWEGDGFGTVYGTALGAVILQLPYGYLPIYQR